jgi:hypothetical protein
MSVNFNRSKEKMISDSHIFRIKVVLDLDPYAYEYRGWPYKERQYRTWKHNRKTQYKNETT